MLPESLVHRWRIGTPSRGSPNADGVMGKALSEIVVGPLFTARLAHSSPHKPRLPNRLMLGSYVLSYEWDLPSANTMAPGLEVAQEIIDHWSPFNKWESSIANMRNLYPTLLRVLVAARVKECSIPFPGYLDRKFFLHVADKEMHFCNHNFNQSAELK